MKKWLKRSLTILAIVCAVAVYFNIGWFVLGGLGAIASLPSQEFTIFSKIICGPDRILIPFNPMPLSDVSFTGGLIIFSLFWPLVVIALVFTGLLVWPIYGCYLLGGVIWAGIKLLPGLIFTGGFFEIIFGNWISTVIFLVVFGIPIYLWIGSRIGVPTIVFFVRVMASFGRIEKISIPVLDEMSRMFLIILWPVFVSVLSMMCIIGLAVSSGINLIWQFAKLIAKIWWRAINFCLK